MPAASADTRRMVTLYVFALLFTVAGSIVVIREVWEAHRRWRATFGPDRVHSGSTHSVTSRRGTAWGVTPPDGEFTVEERLAALEERQRVDNKAVWNRILAVEKSVPRQAADAATEVENRLRPQIAETFAYLTRLGHRAWWQPWWLGPAMLLLGSVLGGIGSVIGAASE